LYTREDFLSFCVFIRKRSSVIYTTLEEVSETFLGFIGIPMKSLEFHLEGVLIRKDARCYREPFKNGHYPVKKTVKQTLDCLRNSVIVKGKHPDIFMKDRLKKIPGNTNTENLISLEYRNAFRSKRFGKRRWIFKK
jgi:hypothetical protein